MIIWKNLSHFCPTGLKIGQNHTPLHSNHMANYLMKHHPSVLSSNHHSHHSDIFRIYFSIFSPIHEYAGQQVKEVSHD